MDQNSRARRKEQRRFAEPQSGVGRPAGADTRGKQWTREYSAWIATQARCGRAFMDERPSQLS
jgi:hypothetical protein